MAIEKVIRFYDSRAMRSRLYEDGLNARSPLKVSALSKGNSGKRLE